MGKVEDDGEEIECAEARGKPCVVTTKVTDEMFKDMDPHIQFKMMLTAMERLKSVVVSCLQQTRCKGRI